MSRWFLQCLYRELPLLVQKGVISDDTAERIRGYYGPVPEAAAEGKRSVALVVFSILGAFLIGAGIILLLAHNWENLSRFTRTIISLTPLVVAQLLCGRLLLREKPSLAGREGAGTFLLLAVGAALSLISQTYHISGSLSGFLLTWMLLSLPVIYFMGAAFPAILYLIGITAWAGDIRSETGCTLLYWPLLALIVPYIIMLVRENRYGARASVLLWVAGICLILASVIVPLNLIPGFWLITFSALFAVMYLLGNYRFSQADNIWQKPLATLGVLGIFILSFQLTYRGMWMFSSRYYYYEYHYSALASVADYLYTGVLIAAAVMLIVAVARRREVLQTIYGSVLFVAVFSYFLSKGGTGMVLPAIVFNIYLFVLSVATMISGIRRGRLARVNLGMLFLMCLILGRFFDWRISFVTRGLIFIFLGVCFLLTNFILSRRFGGAK